MSSNSFCQSACDRARAGVGGVRGVELGDGGALPGGVDATMFTMAGDAVPVALPPGVSDPPDTGVDKAEKGAVAVVGLGAALLEDRTRPSIGESPPPNMASGAAMADMARAVTVNADSDGCKTSDVVRGDGACCCCCCCCERTRSTGVAARGRTSSTSACDSSRRSASRSVMALSCSETGSVRDRWRTGRARRPITSSTLRGGDGGLCGSSGRAVCRSGDTSDRRGAAVAAAGRAEVTSGDWRCAILGEPAVGLARGLVVGLLAPLSSCTEADMARDMLGGNVGDVLRCVDGRPGISCAADAGEPRRSADCCCCCNCC